MPNKSFAVVIEIPDEKKQNAVTYENWINEKMALLQADGDVVISTAFDKVGAGNTLKEVCVFTVCSAAG